MMEFLVAMRIHLPPEHPRREEILARERERALALRGSGAIKRIWRVPGQAANVGVWEAEDATILHQLLSSLPLFPYSDLEVTALATHYLEEVDD